MKKIIVPIAILALVIFVACNSNNDNVAPIEEPAVEEIVEPAVQELPKVEIPEVKEDTTNE